jgi:uncharacterized protein (DUF697 family)
VRPDVKKLVNRTSLAAAAIGAILSPIPLADELILFPIYASLTRKIGKRHGLKLTTIPWRPIMSTAAQGLAARAVVNLSVSFIPGVAAVANAISAAGLTELVGHQADEACRDPANAKPWGSAQIVEYLKNRKKEPKSTATF